MHKSNDYDCYTDGQNQTMRPNRPRTMRLPNIAIWLALSLITPWAAQAQVKLITEEEAKTPNLQVPTTRAITRGPGIVLLSPAEVQAKAFALKIAFEPRGGSQIDSASIKFEYLKQPVLDLTARFKSGLTGNQLNLPQASVPVGAHPIRVSVRDSEGRETSTVIQLSAK